jgi:hypothetical protein
MEGAAMYVANTHGSSESGQSMLVTDKRGTRFNASRGQDEWLPISELGSKAVYQVHAESFTAVTPTP